MTSSSCKEKNVILFTVLGPSITAICCLMILGSFTHDASANSSTETNVPVVLSGKKKTSVSILRNGKYSAEGSYRSPGGTERVTVTVTLKEGVIKSASFKGTSENPTSRKFMAKFSTGFKSKVIGKKIETLALTVVNGSSLTPMGFMDAIRQIKIEAS